VIILTPSLVLQVVTGGSQPIEVNVSWVDQVPPAGPNLPITFIPDGDNLLIDTPTTKIVVDSPPPLPVGIFRNVKDFTAFNAGALPEQVTVQVFDGAIASTKYSFNLPPGYTAHYSDFHDWETIDDQGKILVTGGTIAIIGSINISAGTTSNLATAFTFSNSNNVSFGLGNSTITASAAFNLSAGTTSNNLSGVTFSNANGISFGLDGSVVTASLVTSLSNINISGGTTSGNVSAVTFSNANNVSFGFDGSNITASVATAAGTISAFSQDADFVTNFPAIPGIVSLQKLSLPMNLLATEMAMIADFRGSSASSGAVTIMHGVYTLSGSTARLASSASRAISWQSGSAATATSQFGGASGTRYRSMAVSYSMTQGDYLFGWQISTANGIGVNIFGRAAMNIVGGYDGVETNQFINGSSFSAALPTSVVATDTGYMRTGFSALLQPGVILFGTH
jgi:hypothetical protein